MNEWMNEWIARMTKTNTIKNGIQDDWMNAKLECLEL